MIHQSARSVLNDTDGVEVAGHVVVDDESVLVDTDSGADPSQEPGVVGVLQW